MLLLVFVFIFSNIYIKKLERKILPMIDAGCHAAETEDFSAAHSAGESIYQLLMDSEPTLKLLFSHRDILEIQLYAAAIADLGADGERDEYIENFSATRDGSRFYGNKRPFPGRHFLSRIGALFRTLKCARRMQLCRSTVRVLPYFMLNRYLSENIFLISGLVSNFFAWNFPFHVVMYKCKGEKRVRFRPPFRF